MKTYEITARPGEVIGTITPLFLGRWWAYAATPWDIFDAKALPAETTDCDSFADAVDFIRAHWDEAIATEIESRRDGLTRPDSPDLEPTPHEQSTLAVIGMLQDRRTSCPPAPKPSHEPAESWCFVVWDQWGAALHEEEGFTSHDAAFAAGEEEAREGGTFTVYKGDLEDAYQAQQDALAAEPPLKPSYQDCVDAGRMTSAQARMHEENDS